MQHFTLPLAISEMPNGPSTPLGNVSYHAWRNIPGSFSEEVRGLKLHRGHPLEIIELDQAWFLPGDFCVYDNEGRRVDESCIRRGVDLRPEWGPGRERVELPDDFEIISEPVLFLSALPNHWGHLLTESSSRLWPRRLYPEFRNMAGFLAFAEVENLGPQIRDVLACFNLELGRNIHLSSRPVRFDKCFVPYPSFSNRGEAFTVHRDQFAEIAERYLDDAPICEQPVYLSRSKFSSPQARLLRREQELEAVLAREGVKIIFPEEMSLKEQINIFNQHERYLGAWGTAFHNLMFRVNSLPATTDMITHGLPNANFLLVDAITDTSARYVECMYLTPGAEQAWPKMDLTIEIDQFVEYASWCEST